MIYYKFITCIKMRLISFAVKTWHAHHIPSQIASIVQKCMLLLFIIYIFICNTFNRHYYNLLQEKYSCFIAYYLLWSLSTSSGSLTQFWMKVIVKSEPINCTCEPQNHGNVKCNCLDESLLIPLPTTTGINCWQQKWKWYGLCTIVTFDVKQVILKYRSCCASTKPRLSTIGYVWMQFTSQQEKVAADIGIADT